MLFKQLVVFLLCFFAVSALSSLFEDSEEMRKGMQKKIPCEKGWFLFGEKCLRVSGARRNDRASWYVAQQNCANAGGNLATIASKEENDFILIYLLLNNVRAAVWIGLHDQNTENSYEWIDGSPVNYTNWKKQHPPNGVENADCVEMSFIPVGNIIGQWASTPCLTQLSYVCQKNISDSSKSQNPQYCSKEEGRGLKFQNSCYNFVKTARTWEEAEDYCRDIYNGNLVTMHDITIDYFLVDILPTSYTKLWIGIKIKDEFQQQWTSGWYVAYKNVDIHNNDFQEGTCVVRNGFGSYTIVPCSQKHQFVCETSRDFPPALEPAPAGSYCPKDPAEWRDLGGKFCYYFGTSVRRTWFEASFDCKRRGGELASIHSREETEILHNFVKYVQDIVFIGLLRNLSKEERFIWADHSVMDYSNWRKGKPNQLVYKCGEIWTYGIMYSEHNTMEWNDGSCHYPRGYICSVPKSIYEMYSEMSPTEERISIATSD